MEGEKMQRNQPQTRVIAIGGSADGFKGLVTILQALPPAFPAAVVITQHRRRGKTSVLARLLARRCRLPVKEATAEERLRPSVVYLAPPDHHLVVDDGHLGVTAGPPVNFSRPSIDVTFTSVASRCGSRAIGVVLSCRGRDRAQGLQAIKDAGGTPLAPGPLAARVAMMPLHALAADHVDFTLPIVDIGPKLVHLVTGSPDGDGADQ